MARIRYSSEPSLTIHRDAFYDDKLVYLARANRKFSYVWGKSNVGYIGTTKNGAWRIASSAAHRGWTLFDERGVKSLDFHVVTCTPIPGMKSWKKLERALLIRFCERYGDIPWANKQGLGLDWENELDYFSIRQLDDIIDG
jgi:hypothetical protein